MSKIELGCIARERITGFEGVVVSWTRNLSNIDRYGIHPRAVKDGKPVEGRSFDASMLEYVGPKPDDVKVVPIDRGPDPVALGDTVRLSVSRLEGVVTTLTVWSEGCVTLGVQPRELKDGVPVDPVGIDERQVEVLARATVPEEKRTKVGGPMPEPPKVAW